MFLRVRCVVGIATTLRAGRFGGSNPDGGKSITLRPIERQTGSGAHQASYSVDTGANHSTLSSSEVKNDWTHTSACPIYLSGVHREAFTLFLTRSVESTFLLRLPQMKVDGVRKR